LGAGEFAGTARARFRQFAPVVKSERDKRSGFGVEPRRWRPLISLSLVAVVVMAFGCGSGPAGRTAAAGDSSLVSGARGAVLAPAEQERARRAAAAFADSYAASIHDPRGAVVHAATHALTRQLRAMAGRVPAGTLGSRPRVVSLAFDPRSASRVMATMVLREGSGAPFPIVFWLHSTQGRWLVTRLLGN
jgi:hypothetical protein